MYRMLEFDKVKDRWRELTKTEYAVEMIESRQHILNESELRRELKDTTDAKRFIEKCGAPPLTAIDEGKKIIVQAEKEGCLTPYQLERMEKVLVMIQRMKDYLNRGKAYGNSLAFYEENLEPKEELKEEIARQIRGERVDDHASRELFRIRNEIMDANEKMKEKAEQFIRSHKDCMADSYSTQRNGRICIPVKKECRRKIEGSVLDKSSSGNTLFMEPAVIGKLQEEVSLLQIEEENEVYRILYTLTAMVADCAEEMEENIKMIEKLDYIFSKGKLSIDMDGREPQINLERRIVLKNARHPLMEKKSCVPLQFQIGGAVRGIVITGPNTGGKTVAIKTVALNCLMAQCGLHVTCDAADICMNSSFLCDIGDGQNITENLSTFSSHIKNVMKIVDTVDEESLVIMDELGSGTDPAEGMGIAIAIMKELQESRCLFLLTTHYPELKDYTEQSEGVVNARMEFDRETLRPTYRMVIGEAGESCAFYIARKLGMPERMLKNAVVAAYGEKVAAEYEFVDEEIKKTKQRSVIRRTKKPRKTMELSEKFQIGDSVMILPDKKLGIVCQKVNAKGMLRVQMPEGKIAINHKRVKLQVPADDLYPEDYDFSILFDTVEQRKMRHEMERKYVEGQLEYDSE
ncbi:MAG: DNA mismatch repair protein MutS [Lachnospiraceae bacterium]|nr:DNA mismatch repair protein MutS [Lachnospiraceae bacterium]